MSSVVKRTKRPAKITAPVGRALPAAATVRRQYFNRELSYLAFNRRVLEQAQSPLNPLLERVKFLAIVSSNLDEFFEIRVAGLLQQQDSPAGEPSIDGLTPREQLKQIRAGVHALVRDQYRCWHDLLVPALAAEGIHFLTPAQFDAPQRAWAEEYFEKSVLPVLTPLAVDQAHPFPQLGNKTMNVLLTLDNPETAENEAHFAILPVPRSLPRLVLLPETEEGVQCFFFLSDLIKLCAGALFPGYVIRSAHAFRVTRNSDLYIDEEEVENLLKKIEEELRNLRRGAAVRLEIEDGVGEEEFGALCRYLALPPESVFRTRGPLNLLRLLSLHERTDRPDLKYPPFVPAEMPVLRARPTLFDTVRERDVLLHHPYDSFAPVVEFIEQAALDPAVLAIKQTLYRTSGDSPVVRALSEASRRGKQVTALVELKARFDEANNIKWARELEEAGVHVVFGLVGHKTHCKCSLIVRQEPDGLRRYVHLGTGNYNPKTARLYTDLSLLTAQPELTAEVAQLFNTLTGLSRTPEFRHLLVAPFNLHARIQELIAAEAAHAAAGRPARIVAKMNKLVDPVTIDNLYAASQAGVQIDLIVRATCCLAPGIKGQSENIRVRNLVGRYLEHARVYYFENGGQPLLYGGSADWMTRNFFRRVEALFPISDPESRRRIIDDLLPAELRDNVDARRLLPDATYAPVPRAEGEAAFSAQNHFMAAANARAAAVEVLTP
ncbi:MAG: polyphosphate kinase 1 [Candidatus Didemnitutus sp.]|nr:polyphosphate kinase 1 [Candidatus Didemnitutus sp.]